jgi:RNA polymerase sigma-70 factor (ECF subfamily)
MSDDDLRAELERLHPASFGWALGCCRWDREEAEEVLQVVYLKVLDGRARFDGRSSLKTWLFAILRRTAAERRRRGWLRALAFGRWAAARRRPHPVADPEALLRQSEGRHALLTTLRTLSARQRDLMHLVFYQDLTVEEAARVLGIRDGTARRHYARGKELLRRRLAAGGQT